MAVQAAIPYVASTILVVNKFPSILLYYLAKSTCVIFNAK
jgi:hypothetical protein